MLRLLAFLVTAPLAATDTTLVFENPAARYELHLRDGRLFLAQALNKLSGVDLTFPAEVALGNWPGEGPVEYLGATFTDVPATPYRPAHRLLEVQQRQDTLELTRRFELYPGSPALRGSDHCAVRLPGRHWKITTVAFRDQTDHHNDLVEADDYLLFNATTRARGNLLLARRTLGPEQLWLLKEAPLGKHQLDDPGYDFAFGFDRLALPNQRYTWVLGVSAGTEATAALADLRRHQLASYRYRPQRDEMVLMNTWGDRGQDGKVSEAFVLRELEIAAALGITHFQIDDGWQAGLSQNSISASGQRWRSWQTADWRPHPERFPRGLAPVAERAQQLDMELGLWFNASSAGDYAQWQRDADILIDLYREHGIRTFKMDGLNIPNATADANLRRLFDRVREGTDGRVVFNLDATADRRGGYFYLTDYGNVFLENRYTDWGKYYPHWTLRNLWQLAHYVPPAKLQIEFLNPTRNADQYPPGDSLAPRHYPFDYLFATTAVAQPLAWMEGGNLPEELRRDSIIHRFAPYRRDLHTHLTLPIGEEPDGTAWTGFQIMVDEKNGYFLIFRELNNRPSASLRTHLGARSRVQLEPLVGSGEPRQNGVGENGTLEFVLPQARSFALWRYRVAE